MSFVAGTYLSNGALTPEGVHRLVDDAGDHNWDIPTIREAIEFLTTYPVVCYEGHPDLMQKTKLDAVGILKRALLRQYSQRLQDFFKSKEDYCE